MADKNPVVMIRLDRDRELRFSHKSMKRWSAYTGKSIADMNTDLMGPEEVEVLMYFMLEKDAADHGETLEMSQMEDLLDMAPLGVVYEKLGEAMEAAFPDKPDKSVNQKNGKREAAGTGRNA